jgi:uncharacterized protein YecT (DUF1311 family)
VAQQHSDEYSKCAEKANTQADMSACAAEELKRADAELNRVYQQLLQKRKSDPVATAKTREAQRAWVTFRDAHMQEAFPAADKATTYGSMFGLDYSLEEASVTRERSAMLRQMLEEKNP